MSTQEMLVKTGTQLLFAEWLCPFTGRGCKSRLADRGWCVDNDVSAKMACAIRKETCHQFHL